MKTEYTANQMKAFVSIQKVFSRIGITNKEVAEIFTSFDSENDVYSFFQFVTPKWVDSKGNYKPNKNWIKKS